MKISNRTSFNWSRIHLHGERIDRTTPSLEHQLREVALQLDNPKNPQPVHATSLAAPFVRLKAIRWIEERKHQC